MSKSTIASNIAIFNKVRAASSWSFQERIPVATQENFIEIGTMILSTELEAYMNEWLATLVNRIGLVLISSKMLRNKLQPFKRGTMEWGELIEEIAVQPAKAEPYDGPELYGAGEICLPNPWCKEKPEVLTHYHRRNRQDRYQTTIFRDTLKKAFTGNYGFNSLIDAIVESLSSGAIADEYLFMKELFSQYINSPKLPLRPNQIVNLTNPITDDQSGRDFIQALQLASSGMTYNGPDWNPAGLVTYTDPSEMYLFIRYDIKPVLNTETLYAAFNPNYLDKPGAQVIELDDFGSNTWDAATGAGVVAVLCERNWFLVLDNLREFTSIFNPKGLYWNYWLHIWQTYATSYFANCVIFTQGGFVPTPNP